MSGPAPGSQCRVCRSPNAAAINAALASGVSGRKVAAKFGFGKDSVLRHVANRHPGAPVEERLDAAGEDGGSDNATTELSGLLRMREQLQGEMNRSPRSDTARELRQVHARIAELNGDDRPKSVEVSDVQGLKEQVARWFVALEAYPEARQAMLAVTPVDLIP